MTLCTPVVHQRELSEGLAHRVGWKCEEGIANKLV